MIHKKRLSPLFLILTILTSNPKFKIRKIDKNKNKNEVKMNRVHYLQF